MAYNLHFSTSLLGLTGLGLLVTAVGYGIGSYLLAGVGMVGVLAALQTAVAAFSYTKAQAGEIKPFWALLAVAGVGAIDLVIIGLSYSP